MRKRWREDFRVTRKTYKRESNIPNKNSHVHSGEMFWMIINYELCYLTTLKPAETKIRAFCNQTPSG